jgi:hypothetical protein
VLNECFGKTTIVVRITVISSRLSILKGNGNGEEEGRGEEKGADQNKGCKGKRSEVPLSKTQVRSVFKGIHSDA